MKSQLRAWRAAAKVSQSEIAKQLGYTSPQFVSNWERGTALPPPRHHRKLAKLLKVQPRDFATVYKEYILTTYAQESGIK